MAQGFGADIPPPVNSTAKRYLRGMKKGRVRWNKLYGNRAVEVMHKTANKMATQEQVKMPPTYKEIFGEANKSGDDSLHDWFTKSRASDGTPGWVQLGGKYAGKPCAKQPGQTTKPKCGSSKMKRDLNKDEEERAFQRKNRQDPNPDARGKVKNVATEETIREAGDYWHPDPKKDAQISGAGNKMRAREDAAEKAKPKEDPKKLRPGESYSDYAKRHGGSKVTKPAAKPSLRSRLANKLGRAIDKIGGINNSYDPEGQMVEAKAIGGAPSGLTSVASAKRSGSSGQVNRKGRTVTGGASMGGMNIRAAGGLGKEKPAGDDAERAQRYREQVKKDRKAAARERAASGEDRVSRLIRSVRSEEKDHEVAMAQSQLSNAEKNIKSLKKKLGKKEKNIPAWMQAKITDTDHNLDAAASYATNEAAGEKDACYHKVKSRYKKWPSAYASGALVKCRKKGADNWGNKSEGVTFQEFQEKALKCWKGCRRVPGTTPGAKGSCTCEDVVTEGDEMKGLTVKGGHKRSVDQGAGLTQKGVDAVNRKTGGNLQTAVTTPPSKLDPDSKAAKRRKSFCARSRSWTGERGKAARRRWNC